MHDDWRNESYPTTLGRVVRYGTADIDAKGGEYRLVALHTATVSGLPEGETELYLASRSSGKDAYEEGPSQELPILIGPLTGERWLSKPVSVAADAVTVFLGERFLGALHGWEHVNRDDEGEAA